MDSEGFDWRFLLACAASCVAACGDGTGQTDLGEAANDDASAGRGSEDAATIDSGDDGEEKGAEDPSSAAKVARDSGSGGDDSGAEETESSSDRGGATAEDDDSAAATTTTEDESSDEPEAGTSELGPGSSPNCELPTNQWVQMSDEGIEWPMQSTVVAAQGAWANGALWVQVTSGALWRYDPCDDSWSEVPADMAPDDLEWQPPLPMAQPPTYLVEMNDDGSVMTFRAQIGSDRYAFDWGSHQQLSGGPPDYTVSKPLLEGGRVKAHASDADWRDISAGGAPPPRYYPFLATMGDRLLVTGGFQKWDPELGGTGMVPESAGTDAALYDPETDSWTSIADAPVIQNPRVPSSSAHPLRLWRDGRLILFDYDAGAIYTEATDSWVATETTAGVSAPGYFVGDDRYVDFGGPPRMLDLNSGAWTTLPSDGDVADLDPNGYSGWAIQVWSGRTLFRWAYHDDGVCTDAIGAECVPPTNIVSGAMYTLAEPQP